MSLVKLMVTCQAETRCLIGTGINNCYGPLDLLRFLSKCLIILQFITIFEICTRNFFKITNTDFIQNPFRKSRVFVCGHTDGQT